MDEDKMHVFNGMLREWTTSDRSAFWDDDGTPCLDYDLLLRMLRVPVLRGDSVRSGVFANALDLWIAREFECAGFRNECVWPRVEEPRAADPSLVHALDAVSALTPAQMSAALRGGGAQGNANVMGSIYTKQVDVGMSGWLSGPELLVSTKTMSGSFGKNIANRFEEAYGDVKNLRERYPLAAHGFFFLAHASILHESSALEKAVHMLRQLSRGGDVYDAVALLLVDWNVTIEMDMDRWSDEPTVMIPSDAASAIPEDLSSERFFSTLIDIVLSNSPVDAHGEARALRPQTPRDAHETRK